MVEADESDKSMLALDVDVAVVLNIELDHHATYGSLAQLNEAFDAFRAAAPARVVAPELARDGDTVFAPEELVLEPGGSRFTWRGHEVVLQVPGAHNARNAAAALEAIRVAGAADPAAAVAALASFAGAGRRFERLGETASRRARRRRLRPPPDRGRGDDRGRALAGAAPPDRDLPAPPVQPDPGAAP